ncbi:MAG TPA: glutamate mutase L [Bacillota bacterium]|nr:glutamate mutase L [Bacillota bacterium]HRC53105.1 glutamate mutase L [Bacillota bacterium]
MFRRILAADIGSTTTKTVLFERKDDKWALVGKTSVPTTVEAPHLDVMIGLKSALSRLQERTGVHILEDSRLLIGMEGDAGVDALVGTSSAGGGLQMVVAGLVKELTAESAHRAALGAGAIVADVIAIDDSRSTIEKIETVKRIRPDMILITGGTDGGNISEVASIAEIVAMGTPEPRFGKDFKLPVIFAGNVQARPIIERIFEKQSERMYVVYTDNIRPVLEKEVLEPARRAIHELFLEHVMMHAPGYATLVAWTQGNVKPTPVAVGDALTYVSEIAQGDVLAVDVGGATTDVFSVIDGEFYRTVSANLGMSYSMGNVLGEAGIDAIMRWLPGKWDDDILRNWNFNKMIRPTTLPQTLEELMLEQVVCKEVLRLSMNHHRMLIRELKGVQRRRTIGDMFYQTPGGETRVDMMKVKAIVGTGGALSYAPRRNQAAMILVDGFQPEGITDLYVDSQFLLPHMGALMDIDKEIAAQMMMTECLIPLGTCIAPMGPRVSPGSVMAQVKIRGRTYEVVGGEITVIPIDGADATTIEVIPGRNFDVGAGPGKPMTKEAVGGVTGVILDGRARPIVFPAANGYQYGAVARWYSEFDAYPAEFLDELTRR